MSNAANFSVCLTQAPLHLQRSNYSKAPSVQKCPMMGAWHTFAVLPLLARQYFAIPGLDGHTLSFLLFAHMWNFARLPIASQTSLTLLASPYIVTRFWIRGVEAANSHEECLVQAVAANRPQGIHCQLPFTQHQGLA